MRTPCLWLFADFWLSLSIIPHWNNTDGGANEDTSRYFVAWKAFNNDVTNCHPVIPLRDCIPEIYPVGRVFLQDEKGEVYLPESLKIGILAVAWDMVQKAVETQFGDEVPA